MMSQARQERFEASEHEVLWGDVLQLGVVIIQDSGRLKRIEGNRIVESLPSRAQGILKPALGISPSHMRHPPTRQAQINNTY